MPSKTKMLVLFHPFYRHENEQGQRISPPLVGYGVASIKNSTEYVPAQWLSKKEVSDLCEISAWEITVRARSEKDH
jgi:hypothetical protein